MGGRGTYAIGNFAPYTFETVGKLHGIKILNGIGNIHGLPEEALSSLAYIQLKPDGTFHEIRFYDKNHYLTFELAYHAEKSLNPSNKPVLHYHLYDKSFRRTPARKVTKAMRKHYKKFLKGVKI